MRHSKSLSALAQLGRTSGHGSGKHAAQAPPPREKEYPTRADAYELLDDCGRGVR
jgi:hypothetical protein